jgi:hypothetical protein
MAEMRTVCSITSEFGATVIRTVFFFMCVIYFFYAERRFVFLNENLIFNVLLSIGLYNYHNTNIVYNFYWKQIQFPAQIIYIFSFRHICVIILKLSHDTPRHEGAWRERSYSSYSFSTSALDGVEWSGVTPRPRFSPGERTPGTHCTGGWVGLRAGLDPEARGKFFSPLLGIEPR